MKQFLILSFLVVLICCKEEKTISKQAKVISNSEKVQEKTKDTISYWPTSFDTISTAQEILIGNSKHKLEIISFSLNDSSITRLKANLKEVYHNHNFELVLSKQLDTVFRAIIQKKHFKDSLNIGFYKNCILSDIKYEGIRSNRLYFKGSFSVPDTDWMYENDFAVFYRTKKKHKIDSWNYKEIQ